MAGAVKVPQPVVVVVEALVVVFGWCHRAGAKNGGRRRDDHDFPEVTLRVAFAQLAAMFAEGRASYVPAQGDTSLPHLLFGG